MLVRNTASKANLQPVRLKQNIKANFHVTNPILHAPLKMKYT